MKLFTTVLSILMLTSVNVGSVISTNANEGIEEANWSNFESLPADFELFNRSDKTYTDISFSNGEMVVSHNNASAKNSKYYGALLQINKSKYYQDFTFEMEFDIASALNEKSFIGLMYRAQKTTSYLSGYLSKYQYGGGCYFVGIDTKPTFYSDSLISSPKIDNGLHTIKVEVNRNNAYQYLDNNLISTSDLRSKDSYLGYTKPKGQVALLVSNLTVNVKSMKLKGNSEAPSNTSPIIDTYQDQNNIINAPTVVSEISSSKDLGFSSEKLPSNVILSIDENLNVIGKSKEAIDTLDNVINNKLQHKIIPIIRLGSINEGLALVDYLKENTSLIDLSIISSDASILKKVKENVSYIRAIYEVSEYSKDLPKIANANLANTIVLPSSLANKEMVEYIQARFKTVWLRLDSTSKMDIYNAINSGAYGLVSSDYLSIYEAYQDYGADSFVRRSFNPAHRGLANTYNENSFNGCMGAIDAGATHIEIDAYLTTDNEIVIMHDGTVDRTTNGTGNIEAKTLEEVKQLRLDLKEPYEEVPTLEEIIKGMKQKQSDCVMILEIKSGNLKLIDRLKELIDEYDFSDHIVVISFSLPVLNQMKITIPEIPTSYLGTINAATFIDAIKNMGEYNTGVDTTRGAANKTFNEQYLKDRGILGFYWTYSTKEEFSKDALTGLIGLTTDVADANSKDVYMIRMEDSFSTESISIGSPIEVISRTYDGTENTEVGEVFYLEENESSYKVIAKFRNSTGTYYSNMANVVKQAKPIEDNSSDSSNEPTSSGGCGGSIMAISGLAASLGLVVIGLAFASLKKKEER